MLLTRDNLKLLYQDFLTNFNDGYASQPTYYDVYASTMPSSTSENLYGWLADLDEFREWVGPRKIGNVVARDYKLANKDWELTRGLERNKVADDQYGFFSQVARMMGEKAKMWPDNVCTDVLEAGTSTLCWDGQFFFDGDHPVDFDDASKGTYRNYYDSTVGGGGTGYPLNATNVNAGMAFMQEVVGEGGRTLNVTPSHIMVAPRNRLKVLEICQGSLITQIVQNVAGNQNVAAAAPDNLLKGMLTPIVNPRLSDPDAWYLLCCNRGLKPIVWQLRQAVNFVMRTSPDDPHVFDNKEFIYGSDGRGNAGYSLPFLAFKFSV